VKIVHARVGLAPQAEVLLQSAQASDPPPLPALRNTDAIGESSPRLALDETAPNSITGAEAIDIYQACMRRWRITERFPQPDFSIVDLWVAKYLFSQGTPVSQVQHILRLASPHFPRRHSDPDNYLRRTVARAIAFAFPRAPRALCAAHAGTSTSPEIDSASNSTGGR